MKTVIVKLLIEDVCNPHDGAAAKYVKEMLYEVFSKEERQEFPRVKLILLEVTGDK